MKRIIAFIRPIMRDDTIAALHQVENFPGAVMSEISGIRRGLLQNKKARREVLSIDFPTYIRIEMICADHMVTTLVETIRTSARTGKRGDGKIFVSPVESTVRIHDGHKDSNAI